MMVSRTLRERVYFRFEDWAKIWQVLKSCYDISVTAETTASIGDCWCFALGCIAARLRTEIMCTRSQSGDRFSGLLVADGQIRRQTKAFCNGVIKD